jgi:predicted nucleic acid-binding protein
MRFLDANVILRYLTKDDPAKAHACFTLFQQVKQGKEELQTTESVIAEVTYVLSSPRHPYKRSHADIAALLRPVVKLRSLRIPRKRVVLRALELYDLYPHFDFEDALSLATMEQSGLTEIVSYGRDFDRVPGITREEP